MINHRNFKVTDFSRKHQRRVLSKERLPTKTVVTIIMMIIIMMIIVIIIIIIDFTIGIMMSMNS